MAVAEGPFSRPNPNTLAMDVYQIGDKRKGTVRLTPGEMKELGLEPSQFEGNRDVPGLPRLTIDKNHATHLVLPPASTRKGLAAHLLEQGLGDPLVMLELCSNVRIVLPGSQHAFNYTDLSKPVRRELEVSEVYHPLLGWYTLSSLVSLIDSTAAPKDAEFDLDHPVELLQIFENTPFAEIDVINFLTAAFTRAGTKALADLGLLLKPSSKGFEDTIARFMAMVCLTDISKTAKRGGGTRHQGFVGGKPPLQLIGMLDEPPDLENTIDPVYLSTLLLAEYYYRLHQHEAIPKGFNMRLSSDRFSHLKKYVDMCLSDQAENSRIRERCMQILNSIEEVYSYNQKNQQRLINR